MRIAIIDMGTNTFNLLIQDTESAQLILKNKISVRLGEGGLLNNKLLPSAMERGIAALQKHKKSILENQVTHCYAFATSAVRSAKNGKEFAEMAALKTGIKINIISGDTEANLIYEGVKLLYDFRDTYSLIMDIGGGSTEFILVNSQGVKWQKSYDLGVSRLMQIFNPSDIIEPKESENIYQYLDGELAELLAVCKKFPPVELIGSSGSFDTLAQMIIERHNYKCNLEESSKYEFQIEEYHEISELMMLRNFEQRLNTPGMIPMRADLIVMACILVNHSLDRLSISKMKLSAFALKEGVFKTLEKENTPWQESLL